MCGIFLVGFLLLGISLVLIIEFRMINRTKSVLGKLFNRKSTKFSINLNKDK